VISFVQLQCFKSTTDRPIVNLLFKASYQIYMFKSEQTNYILYKALSCMLQEGLVLNKVKNSMVASIT